MNRISRTMIVALTGILGAGAVQGDPPLRNMDAVLVTDFITAADGTLDSPDDLLMDRDPCDPERPDVLEPVTAPDGRPLTLGELSAVSGKASAKCDKQGTHVTLQLAGLIPNGVYTIWLLIFELPGFTPDFAHFIGEGSLGPGDGSRNSLVASAEGRAALSVRHPAGALSEFGEVTNCLFDEFEFHLVGAYHPDGLTYGPTPGPADAPNMFCYFVEHFAFVFQSDVPERMHKAERVSTSAPSAGLCGSGSDASCIGLPERSGCTVGRCGGVCKAGPQTTDCSCVIRKRSRFCL